MIGPIFCENITRQRFSSLRIRECTDTSSATKMLSCDRESFSGVLSVKSVRPALTRTKTNPSLSSRTSYSQHISPSPIYRQGFFCALAEKRAVAQTSDQQRTKWPQNFSCRVHPRKKHFCFVKILWKFRAACIVFSFSLGRGAKSSFCVHAYEALVLYIYLHSHKLFVNIFYLLNPTIWNSHCRECSAAHKWQVAFLHKFVYKKWPRWGL